MKVTRVGQTGPVQREPGPDTTPKTGEWYWVKDAGEPSWLGCVVRVGSNYAKVEGPSPKYSRCTQSERVHLDRFHERCTLEPDAAGVIGRVVAGHRMEIDRLVAEARELSESLGLSGRSLAGGETQAIAVRTSDDAPKVYKAALVKARDKTLPKIFEEVEQHAQLMSDWMAAEILPMKAEANSARRAMKRIESRITNIELYAGLTEQVAQIRDGKPAPLAEPVHLMQRMHYMDEECLAHYEVGGMVFDDIPDFDAWMAKPVNADRLLPYPRCVIAMQVRREHADRTDMNLEQFIGLLLSGRIDADKATFLYLRNGAQLFRLSTTLTFRARLFPDFKPSECTEQLYGYEIGRHDARLATQGEYDEAVAEHAREEAELAAKIADAKRKRIPKDDWVFSQYVHDTTHRYTKFSRDNVHYDEIAEMIRQDNEHHNRLALILQGLLDRSMVFHPHPKWQLWDNASFEQAIRLVYDDTRALVPGSAPDFEAYRARLNRLIRVGSLTTGQELVWMEHEAVKHNAAMHANWRVRHHRDVRHFVPHGNPGPGRVAPVVKDSPRGCLFRWERERLNTRHDPWEPPKSDSINCTITAPTNRLFNVSAYTPGDFRQFYNDPRTRAEYLKWAPLLLTAEEWHAGNTSGRPDFNKRRRRRR